MAYVFVTLFSLGVISCSSDDEDDPYIPLDNKEEEKPKDNITEQFNFKFNGQTYYYARITWLGDVTLDCYCDLDLYRDYWETPSDNCTFNINAYDIPNYGSDIDVHGNFTAPKENYEIECWLYFKKFDPRVLKTGDVLEIDNYIKYWNNLTIHDSQGEVNYQIENHKAIDITKKYLLSEPYQGTIRFVSYTKHPDGFNKMVTLEFINVTFEEYQDEDYSNFLYKAKTVTINGNISFKANGV